ncbi:MAG: AAA family ATPase [Candidatus Kapaibacterium sp.]
MYTHTEMVLDECYKILEEEKNEFTSTNRLSLILGTAFHDIAKPLTTRTQVFDGVERIVAPRHADRGRSYIAAKLLDLELPIEVVHDVMMIVGHHHDPKKLVQKNSPPHAYHRLARIASPRLLYYFERADMSGRICKDKEGQLEILEIFRLFAEETNTWNNKSPYSGWEETIAQETPGLPEKTQELIFAKAIHSAEAGLLLTPHEELARSYSYRNAYPELYVLCGPSGSGKSTWSEKNILDARVISLDKIREEVTGKREDQSKNGQVAQLAKERLREALRTKSRVIWDATCLNREQRGTIIQLGMDYQAMVTLVVFYLPEQILREQNQNRQHPVPDTILTRQFQKFDFPYLDEAHRVIYIDKEGKEMEISKPLYSEG